ncbi:MAG TPA: hypothetical protein VH684_16615 [Xanthobacteraceae bacterium]
MLLQSKQSGGLLKQGIPRPFEGSYGVSLFTAGNASLTADGIREALWITLAITAAITAGGVVLYWVVCGGLPRPDLRAWLEKNRPAFELPSLAVCRRLHG